MKLKHSMTLIIVTSIITSHNSDAAYLWQRAKDMYNYRFPSLVTSAALAGTALGTYAYSGQEHQGKILAALLASGLLFGRACTAPDTSTLEGLVAAAASNTGYNRRRREKPDASNIHSIKMSLIADMHSKSLNGSLSQQISALDTALKKTYHNITDTIIKNPNYSHWSPQKTANILNQEGAKQSNLEYAAILDSFVNNPATIKENDEFQKHIKAILEASSSKRSTN